MDERLITRRRRPRQSSQSLQHMASQFRLDEMMIFNQVAELGSFSAAAKNLGITQSTVSKRIRKLEQSLDLRLFDRTTRHVALTELGRTFLGHSQRLLADFDQAVQFVQQSRQSPHGLLRVGIPQWFLSILGSDFFARFIEQFPGIQFSFVNPKTAERQLEQADVDLMLHFVSPHNKKLNTTPLWQFQVDFFVGKGYLQKSAPLSHPEQLTEHECLLIRNYLLPDQQWLWIDDNGRQQAVDVKPLAWFDHVEQALDWALQDLGVVWGPVNLVKAHDTEGQLANLFDGQFASTFTMSAIYPARQVILPTVDAFVEALSTHLAQVQG